MTPAQAPEPPPPSADAVRLATALTPELTSAAPALAPLRLEIENSLMGRALDGVEPCERSNKDCRAVASALARDLADSRLGKVRAVLVDILARHLDRTLGPAEMKESLDFTATAAGRALSASLRGSLDASLSMREINRLGAALGTSPTDRDAQKTFFERTRHLPRRVPPPALKPFVVEPVPPQVPPTPRPPAPKRK